MVMRKGSTYLAIAIVVVYLILAVASSRTLMPWCDEAWFAGPAYNLITHGYMGTPVLDPTSAWFLVVKKITGDTRIGLLTAAVLATDFTFLWGAGVGRMDMMCEALGLGG